MKMRQDVYVKQHCESKGDLQKENKAKKRCFYYVKFTLSPYLAAHPDIEVLEEA